MATVSASLALLAARGANELGVLHNDLPTNDWRSLAKNLAGPDSYLRRFPQARALFAPRSFFERVTLPSSITLGTSYSAAHWLSRQPPDIDMPTTLYRSDPRRRSWQKFSNRRRVTGKRSLPPAARSCSRAACCSS